jgi:hypothetical protein
MRSKAANSGEVITMYFHILPKGTTLKDLESATEEFRRHQYDESGTEYDIVCVGKSTMTLTSLNGHPTKFIEAQMPKHTSIFASSITQGSYDFLSQLEKELMQRQSYLVTDKSPDELRDNNQKSIEGELYELRWKRG